MLYEDVCEPKNKRCSEVFAAQLTCYENSCVKIIPFPRVGSLIAFPCFAYVWLSRFWLGLDLWRYGASL